MRKLLNQIARLNLYLILKVKINEISIWQWTAVVVQLMLTLAVWLYNNSLVETPGLVKFCSFLGMAGLAAALSVAVSFAIVKTVLGAMKLFNKVLTALLGNFKLSPEEFLMKLQLLSCEPTAKKAKDNVIVVEYNNLFGQRVKILADKNNLFNDANVFSIRLNKELYDVEVLLQERRLAERFPEKDYRV